MNDERESKMSDATIPAEAPAKAGGGYVKIILFAVIAVALLAAFKVFNVSDHLKELLTWINNQGAWGPAIFIGVYAVATVLFIPGSVLTLGSGVVFGVIEGTIYVTLGANLGAALAFLVGRYAARDAVAKKIEGNERFAAIDSAVAEEGWKIVFLTRLSPIFPFTLLNYAFGLTKVKFRDYVLASLGGMIPGTLMYVYIGSLAGSVATLGAEGEKTATTPGEWALRLVGFLATVGVTVYVTRIARRALKKRVDTGDDGNTDE